MLKPSGTIFALLALAAAAALTAFGFLSFPPVIRDLQALSGELPARVPALLQKFKEVPFADRLDPADAISWIQGSLSSAAAIPSRCFMPME